MAAGGRFFRTPVVNDPITLEHTAFIIHGQTTRDELLQALGAPQEITATLVRDIYRYRDDVYKTFRISVGSRSRGFVPLTLSRGNSGLDMFIRRRLALPLSSA